jgi:hypothetical protein
MVQDLRERVVFRARRRGVQSCALLVIAGTLLAGCGDKTDKIAGEACDLAQQIMSGKAGLISAGLQLNDIRKEAKSADVSWSDILNAAGSKCPDVVDKLP